MLSSCSLQGTGDVTGNIKYSQDELKPSEFNNIHIEVVADVYYTQNDGNEHDVKLDFSAIKDASVAQKMKEQTKVVYRCGAVEIGQDGRINGQNLKENQRLKIYITSPDLLKVHLEGVGTFNADTINTDSLDIDNEGVGSVYIKQILANKVMVDNEGVGSVKIGLFKGGNLDIDNEGVGSVKARVDCHSVDAKLEGVGSITLSGTTHFYHKDRDGIGSFHVGDLKVLSQKKK